MLYRSDKRLAVLLFIQSIAIGCVGISCTDDDEEQPCSPGQTKSCRCPGGKKGTKICLDSERFSSCRCAVSGEEDYIKGTDGGWSDAAGPGSADSVIDDQIQGDVNRSARSEDEGERDAEVDESNVDADADSETRRDSDESNEEETDAGSRDTGDESNDASAGSGGSGGSGGESGTGETGGNGGTGGYDDYKFFCDHEPASLPVPTGACPTIATTIVDETTSSPLTFRGKRTEVIVEQDPDPNKKGPLVFYWHGLGGHPNEVFWGLGIDSGLEIIERGGMIVAMYADETATGTSIAPNWDTGHLAAADEILACAIEQIGIDTCRIHAMGFSAGGLMTTQMSYRRSDYIASVVSYSGGIYLRTPSHQDPNNKFAAMIVHGGANDVVIINFETTSTAYLNDLRDKGHFAFICDHGGEHTVPESIIAPAWRFLKDHPYGITPDPYRDRLPGVFPDYCSL